MAFTAAYVRMTAALIACIVLSDILGLTGGTDDGSLATGGVRHARDHRPAQSAELERGSGDGGPRRYDALPDTSTSVSGTASWYCGGGSACTRGYPPGTLAAAAGPALRVGDWRGRIVKVCSGGRCVKVQLVDWCFCGSGRVIDLYRSAFSRLANPSRGLLRVSITWGGSTVVLPPTDTR